MPQTRKRGREDDAEVSGRALRSKRRQELVEEQYVPPDPDVLLAKEMKARKVAERGYRRACERAREAESSLAAVDREADQLARELDEEKAKRLDAERRLSAATSGTGASTFDYEDGHRNSNQWVAIRDQNALRLIQGLTPASRGPVRYTIGPNTYEAVWEYIFNAVVQRNVTTGVERRIRRSAASYSSPQTGARSERLPLYFDPYPAVLSSAVTSGKLIFNLPLQNLAHWQANLPGKNESTYSSDLAGLGDIHARGQRSYSSACKLFVKPAVIAHWFGLLEKFQRAHPGQCATVRVGFHGSDLNGYAGIERDPLGMDCSQVKHGSQYGTGLYFGDSPIGLPARYNKGAHGMCVAALILMNDVDRSNGRAGPHHTLINSGSDRSASGICVHDTRYVLPLGLLH